MDIGKELKLARIGLDLTQEELKEKTGIAASTIGMIEAGKENPQLRTIKKLADALDCQIIIIPRGAHGKARD